MSVYKNKFSVTQFYEMTGVDRRTIKKRIADLSPVSKVRTANLYLSTEALPKIYEINKEESTELNLMHERARKEKWQADKYELEVKEKQRELVPIGEVTGAVRKEYDYVRKHLLSIPSSCALELSTIDKPEEVQEYLTEKISELLKELTKDKEYGDVKSKSL